MEELIREAIEAIDDLNGDIFEQLSDWNQSFAEEQSLLTLRTDGNVLRVDFCGLQIWNSDDDERECVDEENDVRIDLLVHLRNEINKIAGCIGVISL
jgi:hypothetical protein